MARKSSGDLLGELALIAIAAAIYFIVKYWQIILIVLLVAGGITGLVIYLKKQDNNNRKLNNEYYNRRKEYKTTQNNQDNDKMLMDCMKIDELMKEAYQNNQTFADFYKKTKIEYMYKGLTEKEYDNNINKLKKLHPDWNDWFNGRPIDPTKNNEYYNRRKKHNTTQKQNSKKKTINDNFEDDTPIKGSRVINLQTCTYDDLLTLHGFDEDKAEEFIEKRNNGKMWYSLEMFSQNFNLQPHEMLQNEKNIIFPPKSKEKRGRKIDF